MIKSPLLFSLACESVYLYNLLKERSGVKIWLLSFKESSDLADEMDKKIIVDMEHEGDQWDIVPNNSTVLNLIIVKKPTEVYIIIKGIYCL